MEMVLKKNIMERNKRRKKLILKSIIGGIPIIGIIVFIIYNYTIYGDEKDKFYQSSISGVVIEKSYTWQTGRTNTYLMYNGLSLELSFDKESQLSIGDSIYKKSNTYIYDVYKKNHKGRYEHSGTYDFNEVY